MRDAGHRTPDIGHRTSDNGHRTSDIGHRTAKKAKIIYPPPRGVDIITLYLLLSSSQKYVWIFDRLDHQVVIQAEILNLKLHTE